MISIVIACYNNGEFLEQCVDSVRAQTYTNIELIVIDDGSDIATKRVIDEIKPKIDKIIGQENKGVGAARNVGIKEAIGDYIFILDSDDYIHEKLLEKSFSAIQRSPDIRLVTTFASVLDGSNRRIMKLKGGGVENFILTNAALGTSLYRKLDITKVGGYDETMLEGFEDWDLNLRLLATGGVAAVVEEPLYYYRKRSGSRNEGALEIKNSIWEHILLKNETLLSKHYHTIVKQLFVKIDKQSKQLDKMISASYSQKLREQLGRIFKKITN